MADVTEAGEVDQVLRGPGAGASCGGVVALVLACLGGVFCQLVYVALPYIAGGYSDDRVGMTGFLKSLYEAGFFVVSVIPFVLVVLFVSSFALMPYIPGIAWRGFLWATGVGSIFYWYAFWFMWFWTVGTIPDLSDMMREVEGDLLSTVGAFGAGIGAGAMVALVSALPLAGLQWLALRRYLPKVVHWITAVVVGNAIVTGVFIAQYLWGVRWGWN
jgi:hypothetical protein